MATRLSHRLLPEEKKKKDTKNFVAKNIPLYLQRGVENISCKI